MFWRNKEVAPKVATTATSTSGILNFYECVAAGFPTTPGYPRECQVPNGAAFIEDLVPNNGNLPPAATSTTHSSSVTSYKDLVRLDNLNPNDLIKSPFILKGEARGSWFFEGSFPVEILDSNGNIIGRGIAKATSDWMTSNYVPFTVTVTFKNNSPINRGFLVIRKDNPSGDPSRDDSWRLPVSFN